jgi:hypothetical protein
MVQSHVGKAYEACIYIATSLGGRDLLQSCERFINGDDPTDCFPHWHCYFTERNFKKLQIVAVSLWKISAVALNPRSNVANPLKLRKFC